MNKYICNFIITALMFSLCGFYALCFAAPVLSVANHLSKIENDLWGFDYKSENESNRLSRIEKNVFGQANTNDTIEKRIEKINAALGIESQKEALSSAGELMQEEVEGVKYPQIDQLELKLFSKVYDKENIYKRIERLEKKIFGSTQEGDLASRTDKLKGYLNIDTTPKTVYTKPDTTELNLQANQIIMEPMTNTALTIQTLIYKYQDLKAHFLAKLFLKTPLV